MRFTVNTNAFADALGRVFGAIDGKASMHILGTFRIRAADNALRIDATDLYRGNTTHVECDLAQPGAACFPAGTLHNMVRSLPKDTVCDITVVDAHATLVCGNIRFRIPVFESDDYPELANPGNATFDTVDAAVLARGLEAVHYAAFPNDGRAYLEGVFITWDGTTLTCVATDGHRLSLYAQSTTGPATDFRVLVPRGSVRDLRRFINGIGDSVDIAFDANRMFFQRGDDTLFVTKGPEGFPDYKRVIPDVSDVYVTAEREALVGALSRVGIVDTAGVVLDVDADRVVLSSLTEEAIEDITTTCAVKGTKSALPVRVGFSDRYMLDALAVSTADRVTLGLKTGTAPIRIDGDDGFVAVVMPRRVR